ncbi:MAG: PAS domain S-box protein, partial [Thiohalomonadaceae bacterium]
MNDTTSPRDTAARSMDERVRYLAAIADSSDYAVIGQDADGIIVAWNRGAQRIYGYGPDEIIGQPFHRLVPDERRDEITTLNRRVRQDGRGEHHVTEACRKDGSRFQVALAFLPVLDPHGHATGTSVIGRDITVEMKAVEEKQRAADLLDKIFSGIRILLAYMDRDFNFIKVNRAYAEADEREPEYFVGKNHFDLYPNAENEAMFRLVVETGEPAFVAERPFVYAAHPERGVSYWDWVVQPVRGANGRVEGVLLSLLDVTEKVKTRQKLEATVAYTRSLIEANLDPLVTIGRDGRITDVNRATETVTGRTRQQLVGTDFSDYFTEPEKAQNGYRQAFEQGQVRDYPLEIRHADGHVTPVLYNASVYRDAEGKVVGVFAAARDISERRRAEEALRASEERLRQAQRIAQIGSWELDLVTNVLYWSDEIYRIFEIDKESFGASYEAFLGLVHPDDREAVNRAYNTSVATRTPYSIDHRLLFPDGRIKYVHEQCETFYAEDGTPLRSIGTVQDITARKRAEHLLELRTREQEAIAAVGYAALTGGSLDEFMERAVQLVAETLEVEFTKILELSPEGGDLLLRAGAGWRPGLVQRERVSAGLESQAGYTLMAAEPVIVSDYATENRFPEAPLLREHGVRSGISVIIGERARPYGVLAAHSVEQRDFSRDDVSFLQAVANVVATAVERAHAEEALREANAYNRRLIEASLDPLVTIGPNGTITDVNAATEAVTGRTRGELIGTDFADYFTDPEAARAGYRQVFEQGFVRNYP